jgi:uncharacterized membrane protein YdjX (TVP38/TMEM64 family)
MRLIWILFVLAIAFTIPFIVWGGTFEETFTVEGGVTWLERWGPWAWLAGIILLLLDLVLPIPGTAVMSALGMIYGSIIGGLIGTLGSILSGLLAYSLCRAFGLKIAERIAGASALEKSRTIFAKTGGWIVVLSRWLPIMPEVVSCMAGLSRMPLRIFLSALVVGCLPLAFTFSVIGDTGREHPKLTLALSVLAPAVIWLVVRPLLLRSSKET